MEEDINILKTVLKADEAMFEDVGTHWSLDEISINAIKNLINKYKELRQEVAKHEMQAGKLNQNMVSALEEAFKYSLEIKDLEKQNKEQEKMIELMADYIDLYGECVDSSKKPCEKAHCQECIIEFFRKKAKGE